MLIRNGRKVEKITLILDITENTAGSAVVVREFYFGADLEEVFRRERAISLSEALFVLGESAREIEESGYKQTEHVASPREGEALCGGGKIWTHKFFFERANQAEFTLN